MCVDNHKEILHSGGFPSGHLQPTASCPMPDHDDDSERLRRVMCLLCGQSMAFEGTFPSKHAPPHSVLTTEFHNSFLVLFLIQLSDQGSNNIMGLGFWGFFFLLHFTKDLRNWWLRHYKHCLFIFFLEFLLFWINNTVHVTKTLIKCKKNAEWKAVLPSSPVGHPVSIPDRNQNQQVSVSFQK